MKRATVKKLIKCVTHLGDKEEARGHFQEWWQEEVFNLTREKTRRPKKSDRRRQGGSQVGAEQVEKYF